MTLFVDPDHPYMADSMAFTLLRLPEGWEIRLYVGANAEAYGSVVVIEVPA
ncbi:MAG: hypothetical protein JRD89_18700 [Deltaproteobacteria bacterium]|nr:hypothetical protein [Deltaproteobacteria bacterium]